VSDQNPTVLLTLVLPLDIAQTVEDLLLEHPDLIQGFSTAPSWGHGGSVNLREPSELVSGHSPRTQLRTVGPEDKLRAIIALLRDKLPHANIVYWLVPVIEFGRIL